MTRSGQEDSDHPSAIRQAAHDADARGQATGDIRGVIVDVDGTLVMSNDAHAHAWLAALAEQGYQIPFARVRPLMGMGGDKLLPALVPGLSSSEGAGKRIADRRKEIFLSHYAPRLRAAPGARELIARFRDDGLRLIVATSAKRDELDTLLKVAHVDDLLDKHVTASDAKETKPAPDLIGVALDSIGLPPGDVVVLGDAPFDIESAGKVGVRTIAVRCGGFDDARLAGATAIYDDPADLLAHYEALRNTLARNNAG